MELSLAVNASLVALSKFGMFASLHRTILSLTQSIQQSSARNHSAFRSQGGLMFAVLIRQARSPPQILF